jgi:hypothetical protein
MMNFLMGIILILISGLANAQFTNQQKQYLTMDNLLVNPGLENGKSGWTCANGTFTASSVSGEKIDGALSGKVVLSAQILDCEIKAPTNSALLNSTALILQSIKSSVAGIQVCPIIDNVVGTVCQNYDGSNVLKEVSPLIPFFGSTNIGIKIRTTGAVTGTVFFDGSSVSRMSSAFSGNVTCRGTPACETSFSAYIDTSGVVTENLDFISGNCSNSGTANNQKNCSFNAGIFTVAPVCTLAAQAGQTGGATFVGGPNTSGFNTSTASAGGFANAGVFITCEKVGVDFTRAIQSTGFLANYQPWKIDANIGGADIPLNASVSSYTEITNASLDLVLKPGSATAQIACAGANASSGLTCSASNESLGILIPSIPVPGDYEVCVAFTARVTSSGANQPLAAFQMMLTQNSSQTILQESGSRSYMGFSNDTGGSLPMFNPFSRCDFFRFDDTSPKTLRLMYESNSAPNALGVDTSRNATIGQPDFHITVKPVVPFMVASVANMVTTPGILSPKLYSARMGQDGSITKEIGDFIQGNCTNSTNAVCTFVPGLFTVNNCWVESLGGPNLTANLNGDHTTSSMTIYKQDLAAVAFNHSVQIFCHGY